MCLDPLFRSCKFSANRRHLGTGSSSHHGIPVSVAECNPAQFGTPPPLLTCNSVTVACTRLASPHLAFAFASQPLFPVTPQTRKQGSLHRPSTIA